MEFRELEHTYTLDDISYVPVTTFLKYFEPYKDWKAIAEEKARKLKDGTTAEDLLKEWEYKRTSASKKGTAFHKMMEDFYISKGGVKEDKGKVFNIRHIETLNGVKRDNIEKLEDNTVYVEKLIWSTTNRICGTADLVEVVDGYIHIKDYKTNGEIKFKSFYHPKKGSERLLTPIMHLDDCNFNIYQLQLNLYMYMLLQQNRHLKKGTMTLLHIKFNEDGLPSETIPIKVNDLQREIRSMLEYYKNNKQQYEYKNF